MSDANLDADADLDVKADADADVDAQLASAFAAFDNRTLRRATRRGLARTGAVAGASALAWIGAALVVLLLVSGAWVRGGGLRAGFHRVADDGLVAARPDLLPGDIDCCKTGLGLNASIRYEFRVRRSGGSGEAVTVHLHQDGRGRYHRVPLRAGTPILEALTRQRPNKVGTGRLIDGLPPASVAIAVVELVTPSRLSPTRSSVLLLEPLYRRGHRSVPFSWPTDRSAGLAPWSKRLHRSDGANLARLGLPSSSAIAALARDAKVHGYIVEAATLPELRRLLSNPNTRSLNIADVGFDLDMQNRKTVD